MIYKSPIKIYIENVILDGAYYSHLIISIKFTYYKANHR